MADEEKGTTKTAEKNGPEVRVAGWYPVMVDGKRFFRFWDGFVWDPEQRGGAARISHERRLANRQEWITFGPWLVWAGLVLMAAIAVIELAVFVV